VKVTNHGNNLIKLTKLGFVNAYLVTEDDGFTLVDAMLSGTGDAIIKAAHDNGGEIKRILLTHSHIDHVGSLDELHAKLPNAEVLIGQREARFLAGDMSLDEAEQVDELRGGFPEVTTRPTLTLNEGDMVGSLKAISAPGHTPGHMAFLDVRDNTLIAGDAFGTKTGLTVTGEFRLLFPFTAMATWHKPTALTTAHKLLRLNPARLVVGHGNVIENPVEQMQTAIDRAANQWEAALEYAG